MALKKYDEAIVDEIITSVDTELGDSWNYGSDDLSYLRREYIERFFRLDVGNEEEGFSSYHSPLIQNQTLQLRAYLMRPFNKSKKPIMNFPDLKSTTFINHWFRNEADGKQLLRDSAFNGALLKTMATKVYVKPTRVVEEDLAIFEGDDRDQIEEEIDLFFATDSEIEQVGKTDWEEVEVEVEAFEATPVPTPAPQPEVSPAIPEGAQDAVADLAATEVPAFDPNAPQEAPVALEVEEEPIIEEEFKMWKATVRFKKEFISRKLSVDVIPPYEVHISRQATSQAAAAIVGRVFPMTLSDMKTQFPDAPAYNGVKGKKKEEAFWEDINGEWLGWTQQNEWYTMWLKDNSSYYEGYYFNVAQKQDSPAHAYLVADVDIQLDPYKTGYARWYNVVKVGNYILSCEEISQPSFKIGTMVDVAGRWLGLSPTGDLIWDEDTEVTNNMRAASNAVLQSTYANPIVDEEQVYLEDVINRRPDSVIRRKNNVVPKQGVAAVEWTATPDVSGGTFQLTEKFQEFAGTANGAGKFFQGHESDDISSARIGENAARIIENNSDLMLDDVAHRFWDYWSDVLVLAHNAAIIGRADPLTMLIEGQEIIIDPVEDLKITKQGDIDLVIGSSEEKEKLEQAKTIVETILQLEQAPTISQIITPEGKALALENLFKALGVEDPTPYLKAEQQDPMQSPEVQQAIQQAQQAAQQQAQQEIEAYKQSEEVKFKYAEFDHKVDMDNKEFDFQREQAAAKIASDYHFRGQTDQKIDNQQEQFAASQGLKEEQFEQQVINDGREYELAKTKGVRTEI